MKRILVKLYRKKETEEVNIQAKKEVEMPVKRNLDNEISKEDYIKILEWMKSFSFNDMLKVLSPKEAVIICLKLGYIDEKYFSTDSIANFLGIEKKEVIEITKKILYLTKESINEFLDTAIGYIDKKKL